MILTISCYRSATPLFLGGLIQARKAIPKLRASSKEDASRRGWTRIIENATTRNQTHSNAVHITYRNTNPSGNGAFAAYRAHENERRGT